MAVALLLFLLACNRESSGPDVLNIDECPATTIQTDQTGGTAPAVSKWLYQLQNADIVKISQSGFDILTIDYAADGYDSTRYTVTDMDSLHIRGKTVLAYLSIGEAEDYRYYFSENWRSNPPCWLGKNNPEWPGNYKVQYWAEAWQTIVIGYLDKIIAAGFDGVYLDIIDAYEYWSDDENEAGLVIEENVAAQRMMQFVRRIAAHARLTRGLAKFYIFPQNGVRILKHDISGDFLQTLSGFGIEDLYYDGTKAVATGETQQRQALLQQLSAAGKIVLVVDYVDDASGYTGANKKRIDDFRSKTLVNGFIPFVAREDRELDQMNVILGVQE